MMTIESDVLIHRPMDEVIDFIVAARDDSVWDPQTTRRARSDLAPAGSERFDFYEHYGSDPLAQVVWRTKSSAMRLTITWTFTAVTGGTRLQAHVEIQPDGVLRLLGPLMRPRMQKRSALALSTVKQVLEGQLRMPPLRHLSETSSRP
jgi:hypothetical protein